MSADNGMTVKRAIFYSSTKRDMDVEIAKSLLPGLERHGIKSVIANEFMGVEDYDLAITIGIKQQSREIVEAYWMAGRHVLFIDKPYIRNRRRDVDTRLMTHYRFALDCFQPLDYFQTTPRGPERLEALGVEFLPHYPGGSEVLFAGSSQKYCNWHDLGDCSRYARLTCKHIRAAVPDTPIVYRPKPSWKDAVPIKGTRFSPGKRKIYEELVNCRALVTHGSNAALDAILAGIPAIVLGDGIAKPLSSTMGDLSVPNGLTFPDDATRYQWACDLAYCQWDFDEMENGNMWDDLKGQLALGERRVWLWRKRQERKKGVK